MLTSPCAQENSLVRASTPLIREAERLVRGGGDEQVLDLVERGYAFASPQDDTLEWPRRHVDRHVALLRQPGLQPPQQATAAGEGDAMREDVLRKLGRCRRQGGHDGVDDLPNRVLDRLPDLLGGDVDDLGQARGEIPALDLGLLLLRQRERRADGDLDLLGGALPYDDGVLLADMACDRLIDVKAPDPDPLVHDDAAHGEHRNL